MALSTTANYNLRKHDAGDIGWDVDMNWNMTKIDAEIKARDADLNTTHVGKILDPTSTDSTKEKHLSNAQAKKWEDHAEATSGNPHGVTITEVGGVPATDVAVTAGANKIPKADSLGKIDPAYLPDSDISLTKLDTTDGKTYKAVPSFTNGVLSWMVEEVV